MLLFCWLPIEGNLIKLRKCISLTLGQLMQFLSHLTRVLGGSSFYQKKL